jgi:hypothetical protein
MSNITAAIQLPYLRYRAERELFIPEFVLNALGTPSQFELMWLDKLNELFIYGCFGNDRNLVCLSPENIRKQHGGQFIKRQSVLRQMQHRLKQNDSDVLIPGHYTAINAGILPGAVAQIAAFKMNAMKLWEGVPHEQ